MSSLLKMNDEQRKAYAFVQLQTVPEWSDVKSIDDFIMEQNKDGLTNVIYKLSKKSNHDDFPILFRIYGAGTNEYLNRKKELEFFHILSKNDFGISLIKYFDEGRMEQWRVGFNSLNDIGCRDPCISRKIAEKLADMHNMRTDVKDFDEFGNMMRSWVKICEMHYEERVFKDLNIAAMYDEISRNEQMINNECSDFVFGHQDILRGNVIRNAAGEILIVDFEYTCILAAPLDICHHFCEWMTRYDSDSYYLDPSMHPTEEEENNFMSAYLLRRNNRVAKIEEVEALRNTVHRFQCFSFFLWFIWAVMQTQLGADWNCRDYALSRWHLYKKLKLKYYGVESLPIISE